MAAVIRDLVQVNAELQEQKERAETVDCKIVTFSLAGKDYGVDIMNIKEIAKADKFTYVPNAASFVKGVYNLRGDIIPIIDLRSFFHLPMDKRNDGLENMLILRVEDRVYGTIVDKIDKVVGINTENIQPPHPIFGDINIKYISGVVEKEGSLYIILDVLRIFSHNKEEDEKKPRPETSGGSYLAAMDQSATVIDKAAGTDSSVAFIKENLPALKNFHPSEINDEWILKRYSDWSATRRGADLQLQNESAADEFLENFYSPSTGRFWDEEYASLVKGFLPRLSSNNIQVWNIGTGRGYETYSFACILKQRYPEGRIKIWANDNDIMAISQAPNMQFDLDEVPDWLRPYLIKGRSGYSFVQAIKDSIVFEYHDVLHENPLPDLDIIFVRDTLSFLPEQEQYKLVASFGEKLKNRGIVFLGKNEVMPGDIWHMVGQDPVSLFEHNG